MYVRHPTLGKVVSISINLDDMLFPPIRPTVCLLLLMSRTSPKLHQVIASLYFLSVISYTRTSVLSPSLGDYYLRLLLVYI